MVKNKVYRAHDNQSIIIYFEEGPIFNITTIRLSMLVLYFVLPALLIRLLIVHQVQ